MSVDVGEQTGETAGDGAKGTRRVVLRAVMVAFDLLPEDMQADVRAATGGEPAFLKTWLPVAVRAGKHEDAIDAFTGPSGARGSRAGEYRTTPAGAWFGGAPRVIEPELG